MDQHFTLQDYQNIVSEFACRVADDRPLIGDCSVLPHPKRTIMYGICLVREDFQTLQERTEDNALREKYIRMIETFNFLLTHLSTNWHDIAPEDKESIVRLRGLDSFPHWALPLKEKYINEDKASDEACEITLQVMKANISQG